jgi:hypothetical protein
MRTGDSDRDDGSTRVPVQGNRFLADPDPGMILIFYDRTMMCFKEDKGFYLTSKSRFSRQWRVAARAVCFRR